MGVTFGVGGRPVEYNTLLTHEKAAAGRRQNEKEIGAL